jgi:hypothetical protein
MSMSIQLPPEFKRELDLQQLARTLSLAAIRCLSWEEIRLRVHSVWNDPQSEELILRVQEMDLSQQQGEELSEEIKYLSRVAEQLHSRDRHTVDRRLMRLARALPQTELYDYALADLNHSRKLRRVGAYKILREVGISRELAPHLVERYRETEDQDLLTLIARFPEAIQAVDVDWLLSELDEQYWRMRVIEGLIRNQDQTATRYMSSYPHEFVHSIGRCRATILGPAIHEVVRTHPSDWDLLSLAAWALGMLGDRTGLAEISQLLERELAANPLRFLTEPGVAPDCSGR